VAQIDSARKRASQFSPALYAMSRSLVSALILLAWSSVSAETNWEKYLAYPSPEYATRVFKIEYSPNTYGAKHGYFAPDLDILRNQVLGRDTASFNLAVRLLKNTDGGLLEEVVALLASSIRPNPNLFLTEISNSEISDNLLKFVLKYPGLEYIDRMDARNYEIEMRRVAMLSVEEQSLQNIKEKCLKLIEHQ